MYRKRIKHHGDKGYFEKLNIPTASISLAVFLYPKIGGIGLNKDILMDYIDACELVKETEADIQKLRKSEVVHDKVSGSNPDFPFQAQNFNISGQVEHYMESSELEKEKQLLQDRMVKARYKKIMVEKWMANAPARIQRLVRLKYFERLSWEQVAERIGASTSADSARMELKKYLKK